MDVTGRRVLGIDPGSRLCGYGVIDENGSYVASGTIRMTPGNPLHLRLRELYDGLTSVVHEFSPTMASVEKVFFARSVRAALSLGHARGVALLALVEAGVEVFEYSPLEIKKAVTGHGKADKRQVQAMVRQILGLDFNPSPDGADALAMAICHRGRHEFQKKVEEAS
jgi:crossover junction endodeoxyribonuclease RuvC